MIEVDGYARNRYRGAGKRGRQPLRTATVDLDHAIEALTRARDAIAGAPGGDDRRGREQALEGARQHAELAQRFVRGVVRGVLGGGRPRKRSRVVNVQLRIRF